MRYWLALFLALTLNAAANLLMRVGARRLGQAGVHVERGLTGLAGTLVHNWVLLLGLVCFAVNVLFYAYALSWKEMKISVAYPIMVSGGFAIIAIVAWRYLDETMTRLQWGGVLLILIGVWLVAREIRPAA